jgi:hypothetical protein
MLYNIGSINEYNDQFATDLAAARFIVTSSGLNTGIVGSNPTRGMISVCVCLCCPVLMLWKREKSHAPAGNRTQTVKPFAEVSRHYVQGQVGVKVVPVIKQRAVEVHRVCGGKLRSLYYRDGQRHT